MIRKTLIVSLTEKEVSGVEYDIVRMTKGPDNNSVILEPVNPGKLLLQKLDLAEAVSELEKFYAQEPPQALSKIEVATLAWGDED